MDELIALCDDDAGELLTLQRAAYVSEARAHRELDLPPLLETLEELRDALRHPDCQVWGARERGRLVAAVRIRAFGNHAEVSRFVVAPDQQGRGLGRRLLAEAERRVPPYVASLRLFTGERNDPALRLYARLGYREVRRTPENGYQLVHLQKHLDVQVPAQVR